MLEQPNNDPNRLTSGLLGLTGGETPHSKAPWSDETIAGLANVRRIADYHLRSAIHGEEAPGLEYQFDHGDMAQLPVPNPNHW